jgi:hypothetical protein
VAAGVGRARENLVHGADPPAPAVARADAGGVQDRLDAPGT